MEPIDMGKFGSFVSARRKEQGLTQKQLGDRLYVTDKTVSKWERGLSLPNVSLLLPLAEALNVTVTELLKGERMQETTLPVEEVEQLVTQSLQLSSGRQKENREERRKWTLRFALCALAALCECAGLAALGCNVEHMASTVYLAVGLNLLFGGWFCIGAPDRLPPYYDEYPISYITDGFFKLHMAGMRFNNRNWPHVLAACRKCTLIVAMGYPLFYALLERTGFNRSFLCSLIATLAASLGILAPVYLTGKKYE